MPIIIRAAVPGLAAHSPSRQIHDFDPSQPHIVNPEARHFWIRRKQMNRFPVQILGFDVDMVQFSNRTGYTVWKGQVTDTDDLEEILSNLHTSTRTS